MLFAAIIALNVLLKADNFSFLGLFFIAFYLYSYGKKESVYYLSLSFISFSAGLINEISINTLKSIIPVLLVSSVFSLMMIGHWFLVDPTINRDGMKNIAKFSMYLSIVLSFLVFVNIYESSSDFFNLIGNEVLNNVIIFLYISSGVLSFGSYKSLQEKSYTGVMASTGLSYLSLIVSLGASGTLILSIWHYPEDMKIYTKKGDQGETRLLYGDAVSKDSIAPEAYGSVDELVAALGLIRYEKKLPKETKKLILQIQRELFIAGAELATSKENRSKLVPDETLVTNSMIENLEKNIDFLTDKNGIPEFFVVPGENSISAKFDWCRVVSRRAERKSVAWKKLNQIEDTEVIVYLNRLSDLLWMLARDFETEWTASKWK